MSSPFGLQGMAACSSREPGEGPASANPMSVRRTRRSRCDAAKRRPESWRVYGNSTHAGRRSIRASSVTSRPPRSSQGRRFIPMRTTQARLRPETVPTAEAENRLGSQPSWLDPSAFPFESRFVELAGCRLHYVDEGAGPPLLFLHGSPMWSFMYRHCLAALRTRYRCLALDMPGLGLSTAPLAWGRQFARTAEVYGAFVDALDLRSLTVITHATAVPPALFMVA